MIELLALAALALALARRSSPVSSFRRVPIEELERSGTAATLGIDNRVPASLRRRATGLGVAVGMILERVDCRMTSAYRSPALTAAVRAANAAKGVNQGVIALPGPGHHDTARGADFAPPTPSRDRAVMTALRDRILSSPAGPLIVSAIAEDDHVHVGFDAGALEDIGADILAKEPNA